MLLGDYQMTNKKEKKMKIVAVSQDGVTISQHFGRAPFYVVVTVEDGKIVSRETRDKMGHAQFFGESHAEEAYGADLRGHGFDSVAQSRHVHMAAAIADCQVLLSRGMGAGVYQSMKQAGIRPVVTDIANIDEAVQAYIENRLVDHTEKLH
jgi:predicted Fe-Mo cluster-binding NifX family protein